MNGILVSSFGSPYSDTKICSITGMYFQERRSASP